MTFTPALMQSCASSQIRANAARMPSTPSATGQVMSIVWARKMSCETWRSVSSSWLRRIGCSITSWWACSGLSSSRFPSAPTAVDRLITTASRIESIGGFVTCAKSCLKYELSGGAWSERTASALSLPIDPIGSSPIRAVGVRRTRMSSCE